MQTFDWQVKQEGTSLTPPLSSTQVGKGQMRKSSHSETQEEPKAESQILGHGRKMGQVGLHRAGSDTGKGNGPPSFMKICSNREKISKDNRDPTLRENQLGAALTILHPSISRPWDPTAGSVLPQPWPSTQAAGMSRRALWTLCEGQGWGSGFGSYSPPLHIPGSAGTTASSVQLWVALLAGVGPGLFLFINPSYSEAGCQRCRPLSWIFLITLSFFWWPCPTWECSNLQFCPVPLLLGVPWDLGLSKFWHRDWVWKIALLHQLPCLTGNLCTSLVCTGTGPAVLTRPRTFGDKKVGLSLSQSGGCWFRGPGVPLFF